MTPAAPFDCADCGRRIGKARPRFIRGDGRVVCVRHHTEHYDAGQLKHGFCTRRGCGPTDRSMAVSDAASAIEKPDPHCCTGCRGTEAGCENKRLFRGQPCCEACEHTEAKETP